MAQQHIRYPQRRTDKESDEVFTPFYAVEPIVKYIPKTATVWCPFDKEWSAYVQLFKEQGYNVIYSHIDDGANFFVYEPEEHYDVIVSNPPFSMKDAIFKRLSELDKPYALLLPVPALQGQKRFPYMKDIQYLGFDKRINYYCDRECMEIKKGVSFGSGYICNRVLPKDLILEELRVYERKMSNS